MDTKICTKCGKEKSLPEFYKSVYGKGGVESMCKECRQSWNRNYHSKANYLPQIEGNKRCAKCGKMVPVNDFSFNRRNKDGRGSYCKSCAHDSARKSALKLLYGLSLSDYDTLLACQEYKCAICKRPFDSNSKSLHVDHNHQSGKVRGLLCAQCNIIIGMCSENPNILSNIISYLEES